MPRLPVLLVIARSTVACGGRGWTGDREPEPLATHSSAPIAFLRDRGSEDDPRRQLVLIDPDGRNERTVRLPRGYDVESLSWSPDGRRIVFAAFPPRDYRPILFVANADGSGLRKLRQTPDHSPNPVWSPQGDLSPSFSPDGKSLAFEAYPPPESGDDRDPPGDIYVINADGSGERKLTDSPQDESAPAWARAR